MDQAYPRLFASVVLASWSRSYPVPHLYCGKKLLSRKRKDLQDIRGSSSYCSPDQSRKSADGKGITHHSSVSLAGLGCSRERIMWAFWESLKKMLKSKFVELYIIADEVQLYFRLIKKIKIDLTMCDQHNTHAVTFNMEISLVIIYSALFLSFFLFSGV